jgi:hypothetical protein
MSDIQAITAVRALLNAGLTIREVAELLRADPRAVEALVGTTTPRVGSRQ